MNKMGLYNIISRSVIWPLGDLKGGTQIVKNISFLEKSQWWPKEKIEEFQNQNLRRIIKHAYDTVPFYRKTFKELGLKTSNFKTREDLKKLPILTRDTIKQQFPDGIVSETADKTKLTPAHTSGSTGEPMPFYKDPGSRSWGWAATLRAWQWAGYSLGDKYIRLSIYPSSKPGDRLRNRLLRCMYFHTYNISEKNLGDYVKKIIRFKPSFIRGYTSAIYLIAKRMRDDGLTDITLDGVSTTGENIFAHQREIIESQFECSVFDGYGSGECYSIAFECEEQAGYHITSENMMVELLRDGEEIGPSELGELVVTNLTNYSMPILRYRVGDITRTSTDVCPCGRSLPLLSKIEGRDTDIIITPSKRFLIVHFFTGFFESITEVDQFQIVQTEPHELTIKIVKNNAFTDRVQERIRKGIQDYAGDDVMLVFDFVDEIPLEKSGKRRFVISHKDYSDFLR